QRTNENIFRNMKIHEISLGLRFTDAIGPEDLWRADHFFEETSWIQSNGRRIQSFVGHAVTRDRGAQQPFRRRVEQKPNPLGLRCFGQKLCQPGQTDLDSLSRFKATKYFESCRNHFELCSRSNR